MLRVYLDQAKWIDFTKCRLGRDDGVRFRGALDAALGAVARGDASFVLSCAHYSETHRRGSRQSRLDLASTMMSLSKFYAIAPPHRVVPAEIDGYLTAGDGRLMDLSLFGTGLGHAFGTSPLFDSPQWFAKAPPELRARLDEAFQGSAEFAILAGAAQPDRADRETLETIRTTPNGDQQFADGESRLAGQIEQLGLSGRLGDVATATEVVDFIGPLIEACGRHGIDHLELLGVPMLVHDLLKSLPSRWITRELRRVRHRNPQQRWHPHDLNDINALSIAVPYRDVVVTERQWAMHINQTGLAVDYGTTVFHDLADLTDVLIRET